MSVCHCLPESTWLTEKIPWRQPSRRRSYVPRASSAGTRLPVAARRARLLGIDPYHIVDTTLVVLVVLGQTLSAVRQRRICIQED